MPLRTCDWRMAVAWECATNTNRAEHGLDKATARVDQVAAAPDAVVALTWSTENGNDETKELHIG